MQKINLFNKTILLTLLGFIAVVAGLIFFLMRLPKDQLAIYSNLAAAFILFSIIIGFIVLAAFRKVNVYESFIEGAKTAFKWLSALSLSDCHFIGCWGIQGFGAMDFIIDGIGKFMAMLGLDTEFVHALPTALMKPLSGSGARGMMIDAMTQHELILL